MSFIQLKRTFVVQFFKMGEQQDMLEESRQGEVLELNPSNETQTGKKLYIESYGCQMNFSDSEIVASVLGNEGYTTTTNMEEADLVFLNTCSIRDKAEETIRKRLKTIKHDPKKKKDVKVGVLGCMAERLKGKLLEEEKLVDLVAGPDAYRDLPNLLDEVGTGQKAVNVLLSRDETQLSNTTEEPIVPKRIFLIVSLLSIIYFAFLADLLYVLKFSKIMP